MTNKERPKLSGVLSSESPSTPTFQSPMLYVRILAEENPDLQRAVDRFNARISEAMVPRKEDFHLAEVTVSYVPELKVWCISGIAKWSRSRKEPKIEEERKP